MQIYDQNKTSSKIAHKSDLGRSWAPFGEGLGRSGSSWGHFWTHFDCLLDVPNHIFLNHWSNMSSKRPFGLILNRFWDGLGRTWGRVGKVSGQVWTRSLKDLRPHNACVLEVSGSFVWFLRSPRCSANSLGVTIYCQSGRELRNLHFSTQFRLKFNVFSFQPGLRLRSQASQPLLFHSIPFIIHVLSTWPGL